MVRLQFHAAPESGARQPQHPSQSKQPLSLCPDPSRCTGSGHGETFSEHFAVEVRRGRWGYLKELQSSGRCHSATCSSSSFVKRGRRRSCRLDTNTTGGWPVSQLKFGRRPRSPHEQRDQLGTWSCTWRTALCECERHTSCCSGEKCLRIR